jgi:hypothetical protein
MLTFQVHDNHHSLFTIDYSLILPDVIRYDIGK